MTNGAAGTIHAAAVVGAGGGAAEVAKREGTAETGAREGERMLGWRDVCAQDVSEAKEKVGGRRGCGAGRASAMLGAAWPSEKAEVAEEKGARPAE